MRSCRPGPTSEIGHLDRDRVQGALDAIRLQRTPKRIEVEQHPRADLLEVVMMLEVVEQGAGSTPTSVRRGSGRRLCRVAGERPAHCQRAEVRTGLILGRQLGWRQQCATQPVERSLQRDLRVCVYRWQALLHRGGQRGVGPDLDIKEFRVPERSFIPGDVVRACTP